MASSLDHPAVLSVMRNLYIGPLRASKIVEEITREHELTYSHVQEILLGLTEQGLVVNIEKNKSNGEAVYKLTRTGESRLEEILHDRLMLAQSLER